MATTRISAAPTKSFFVSMLTRDISLADAILDLLDNCVDGILRQLAAKRGKLDGDHPYKGYWAEIVAKPDRFEICDNCGGISREIAEKSAFRLGRPEGAPDAAPGSVGVYGIGMKRAIFKVGKRCLVTSQPNGPSYRVEISPDWLVQEDNWELQLQEQRERLPHNGTRIVVTDLYPAIARQFEREASPFLDELRKQISQLYAIIMDKGFSVKLNGKPICPVDITLLSPAEIGRRPGEAIEPYVFLGELGGLEVELVVGFYRPLATQAEIDEELTQRRTPDDAGWTVICNDRVVLHNDKSVLTGWGAGGVPSYHNQFISIAGVISFRSSDPAKLPVNTVKRGLDVSSEVYLLVLDQMREGLKKFTSFTNKWKRREEETNPEFQKMDKRRPTEIVKRIPKEKLSTVRKLASKGKARSYSPALPQPETETKTRRISFLALLEDIRTVASYYFDDPEHDKSEVGKRCFDESLAKARRR